jgi:hypothetical protein
MKTGLFALVVSLVAGLAAAGQQAAAGSADPATAATSGTPSPGWSLTPAILVSRTFDDNVLLRGPGDPQDRDYINVLNPRGELDYHGQHSDASIRYDGAFLIYNQLGQLNSYGQHGGLTFKRRLSKRNSFFVGGSVAASPTTELLELSGVPFVRAGSFTDEASAGIESLLSKRTTLSVEATFQQARFDSIPIYASLLLGGNSVGAGVSLRHRLSQRTTVTADADVQHATIGTAEQVFDIQHGMVGIDQQLTESMHVFASGGFSRLGVTELSAPRSGLAWKMGLVEHYRKTVIDVSYIRSFVPSFGFGGTMQNEALSARISVPITRRLYTTDLVSWNREDPLAIAVPQLRSRWIEAAVGYAASPWLRIEAFMAGTQQSVGDLDTPLLHNQYGVQVIASKPMRIR